MKNKKSRASTQKNNIIIIITNCFWSSLLNTPLTIDLRKANSKRAQKSELNEGREARNSPYQANSLHRQTGYFFFLFLSYKNPIFSFCFLL